MPSKQSAKPKHERPLEAVHKWISGPRK